MAKNQVTKVETPRPAFFSADQVALIKRQIAPGASDDELKMFLFDCERSRLDPFARQIYSIERREKYREPNGDWRWRKKRVTQVSIDGFRLIAERTGEYAGQLGPEWCGPDGQWRDVWLDGEPAAARVAVLRKDFEKPLWTPAAFNEYCPRDDKGKPTGLWAKMPAVMIAKCAEALALRRAFPRELSGLYTNDEMAQAVGNPDEIKDVTHTASPDYNDEIPDYADAAPMSAAGAAVPSTALSAAPAPLSLEDMAREAAMRGPDELRKYFNSRSSDDKKRLRKIEAELVKLYPPLTGGK
jgi:phage recombination protein Bet